MIAENYYQPKKEERIYMFMDMRSSTSIAENIGNEMYFNLLNDLLSDTDGYKLIPMGSIELRGKLRKIDLNTVRII